MTLPRVAVDEVWMQTQPSLSLNRSQRFAKRAADLGVAILLLILTAPLMLLVAIAIRYDSSGSVLYQQERIGYRGRRFQVLKFRSMVQNAEKDGKAIWAAERDSRVTRVGRFIRLTRIDELPQLFNVLRGEMSMVGPRPERPVFVDQFIQTIPNYDDRHSVKPGITGWAQVSYGYAASTEGARVKLQYDLYYIENWSGHFDLRILGATVSVVMLRKGAR